MKKLLLSLFLSFVLSTSCLAGDWTPAETTGANTIAVATDELLVAGEHYITAITVLTDGTNDADIDFYDCANPSEFIAGTNTSCKNIWTIAVYVTDYYGGRAFPFPLHVLHNLCADATGTGNPIVFIEYIRAR